MTLHNQIEESVDIAKHHKNEKQKYQLNKQEITKILKAKLGTKWREMRKNNSRCNDFEGHYIEVYNNKQFASSNFNRQTYASVMLCMDICMTSKIMLTTT